MATKKLGLFERFGLVKAAMSGNINNVTTSMHKFLPMYGEPPKNTNTNWIKTFNLNPRMNPVHQIASDVACAEYGIYSTKNKDARLDNHPLYDLLNRPCNDISISYNALMYITQVYLLLPTGEAFWLKERNGLGLPTELWPIPPDWVSQIPSKIDPNFLIRPLGNMDATPIPVLPTDMIYFKKLDVTNPYLRGVGRVEAIGDEIETDEYMAKFQKKYFYNNAIPSMVGMMPGADSIQISRQEEAWRQKFGGYNNSNKAAWLGWDAKIQILKETTKEMDFVESRKYLRDTANQHFCIPPEIFGILENSNRATIDAAYYLYSKNVLRKELKFISDTLNRQLLCDFDVDKYIVFDNVVPEDQELDLKRVNDGIMKGAVTVDEWRIANKMDELPNGKGKVLFIPNSITPVSLDGNSIPDIIRESTKPPTPPVMASPNMDDEKVKGGNYGHSGRPGLVGGSGRVGLGAHYEAIDNMKLLGENGGVAQLNNYLKQNGFSEIHGIEKIQFDARKKLMAKQVIELQGNYPLENKVKIEVTKLPQGVDGDYSIPQNTIRLNSDFYGNKSQSEAQFARSVKKNTSVGDIKEKSGAETVLIHEYGHAVIGEIEMNDAIRVGDFNTLMFAKDTKDQIATKLSTYATKNEFEMQAESFTKLLISGKNSGGVFTEEMSDIVNDYYGSNKHVMLDDDLLEWIEFTPGEWKLKPGAPAEVFNKFNDMRYEDNVKEEVKSFKKKNKSLNAEQRKSVWELFDKAATKNEASFVIAMQSFFMGQESRAVKSLTKSYEQKNKVSDMLNWKEENDTLFVSMKPEWLKGLKSGYEVANITYDFGISPEMLNPRFTDWVNDQGFKQVKEINDTTKTKLQKTLAEGIENVEGIPKLRKRVTEVYAEAKGSRSQLIARTETHNTVGTGTFETYKATGMAQKEWLATSDTRTRDSHVHLNREVVNFDKPFSNGLMFPGDAAGLASEVCNCRCTLLPVIE